MNLATLTLVAFTSANPAMDRIQFFAEQDFCPEGLKAAAYVFRDAVGVYIPGCYKVMDGKVYVLFIDGDSGSADVNQLTWQPGHKPAGL